MERLKIGRSRDIMELRRKSDETSEGEFKIHLLVNSTPLTFMLKLNFIDGSAKYITTSPDLGGKINGWCPLPNLQQFLSPQFLRLFIFDGEFADRLLNPSESEAEKSIDALCQLYLLNDIKKFASENWQIKSSSGPKTHRGLSRYKSKLKEVNERIDEVEQIKIDAENEILELERTIEELGKKIDVRMKANTDVSEKLEEAKSKKASAQNDMERARKNLMIQIRQPQTLHVAFGNSLIQLKNNLDILKLPDITSSTFFEELAQRFNVCLWPFYWG